MTHGIVFPTCNYQLKLSGVNNLPLSTISYLSAIMLLSITPSNGVCGRKKVALMIELLAGQRSVYLATGSVYYYWKYIEFALHQGHPCTLLLLTSNSHCTKATYNIVTLLLITTSSHFSLASNRHNQLLRATAWRNFWDKQDHRAVIVSSYRLSMSTTIRTCLMLCSLFFFLRIGLNLQRSDCQRL